MIGRKLLLLNHMGENHIHNVAETFILEILDFDKIKHSIIKNGKKLGHATIWIILRTYLISSNFINRKTKELIGKIKNKFNKHNHIDGLEEKKEVSKYIKIISEYRQKIRHIKHKIKEEEGIE